MASARRAARLVLQGVDEPGGGALHLLRRVGKGARHALQHVAECRPAEPGLRREIRAPAKGPAFRREEHGERPAPLLAESRERILVKAVDIGPLLAVDLDVHEEPIHQCRSLRVLEAFPRHHVAPVAGRIARREQDGHLALARFRQRVLVPGLPMNRIGAVFQQDKGSFRDPVDCACQTAPGLASDTVPKGGIRCREATVSLHSAGRETSNPSMGGWLA